MAFYPYPYAEIGYLLTRKTLVKDNESCRNLTANKPVLFTVNGQSR